MVPRSPLLFCLALALTLLPRPTSAATELFLHVVGTVQGPIEGDATMIRHEGWINVVSFSQSIRVPIGPNGQATGPAQTSPLDIMKAFDRASVKLNLAASTQEVLSECTLEFVDTATQDAYYRISLDDARVIGFVQSGASQPPTESVTFAFSTITFTDMVQGISVRYPWNWIYATASATAGTLTQGILLPPAPNPTRGEAEFRFSLPSESDAELALFDLQGRLVRELHRGRTPAQPVVNVWDGTDSRGEKVAPGVYMARLAYPGAVVTQRFAVVR